MRTLRTSSLVAAAALYAASAVAGQHGHAAPPPMTHAAPATHATTPHTTAAHTAAPHTGTTTPASTTTAHTTTGSTARTTHTASSSHASNTTSGKTATTTSSIATKVESHPQLASKITAMLPPGTTVQQASSGFKNQGQFIAALHVSQNLGIPFAALKTQMVTDHLSLGQAIQKLRPGTNGTTAARRGETEADDDVAQSGGTPSTTGSSTGTTSTNKTTTGSTSGTTSGSTTVSSSGTTTTSGTSPHGKKKHQ